VDSGKSISLLILVEMFADYKSLVVLDYQKKKVANVIPLSLIQPSPAKLKSECIAVCDERFDRKDEKALKAFFGQGSDRGACLQAIERCDIDKFRPLVNFLKESTGTTDDKNIELLAWLIDFTPRPYEFGRRYPSNDAEDSDPGLTTRAEHSTQKTEKAVAAPPFMKKAPLILKNRRTVTALLILILCCVGAFWIWINKAPAGPQTCMFWAGDHYQPIYCSQRHGDALIIPLDSDKIAHFKKIMRPDTITESALGTIWYVQFQGIYECYTSPGYHPIDTNLKLRLLTDYVLIKHIHPNQVAKKTSE
jgi:hypothetical protein